MDIPQPPKDTSLRNIIDKLAEFVARNGSEFELITKAKQRSNPKFGFLYGGEHYQYYQWRVMTEQAILKQQGGLMPNTTQQPPPQLPPPGIHQMNSQPPPPGNQNLNMFNPNVGAPPWNSSTMPPNVNNVPNSHPSPANLSAQIDAINMQQSSLREQIRQSEKNLTAQHGVLLGQQQTQIDEAITKAQDDFINQQAVEHNIDIMDFDSVLAPIIESCTKDSISSGKNWILQHASDTPKCNVTLQYLLKKTLVKGAPFTQKLHLIYLVNDILHHCARKNADDLKNCLENIVIPMFCNAQLIANDDQKAKLTKLLSLWESKSNFFDTCVISKLRSPDSSMQEYKTNLMNIHNSIIAPIIQTTKTTFENYQKQHQAFIRHASQQIAIYDTQRQTLERQLQQKTAPPPLMPNSNIDQSALEHSHHQPPPMQQQPPKHPDPKNLHTPPPLMVRNMQMPPNVNIPPPIASNNCANAINNNGANNRPVCYDEAPFYQNPNNNYQQQQSAQQQPPYMGSPHHGMPGGGDMGNCQAAQSQSNSSISNDFTLPPPSFMIPDLSRPPPGFGVSAELPAVTPEEIKPFIPYYELPAGLMVPLIRLEDCNYRSLDSEEIRLPPPAPPSERLLSAIDAFYAMPSHDHPRDGEGWEKLGLYEYYKVKNAARKQKEEEITNGVRQRSKSPSPIYIEATKPKKFNKRIYRSKSRSRSRSRSKSSSRSRSRSPPRPSRSPEAMRTSNRRPHKRWSRSQSPTKQLVGNPRRERGDGGREPRDRDRNNRERDRDREMVKNERHRDRERDRERDRGSVSPPPSFMSSFPKSSNESIEESNKGHQMLMKMGWAGSGTGLGSQGQGIDTPIHGGDVRDKQDQYKGVGINLNDPYENFRKNKGAAFIHRMKTRAEERNT